MNESYNLMHIVHKLSYNSIIMVKLTSTIKTAVYSAHILVLRQTHMFTVSAYILALRQTHIKQCLHITHPTLCKFP